MTDRHPMMIRVGLEARCFLEEQLEAIGEHIRQKIDAAVYSKRRELRRSLPAVEQNAAARAGGKGTRPGAVS